MAQNLPMSSTINGISSMATRQVLAELIAAYTYAGGPNVLMQAVGGVDAAKRVQAGEAFDVVLLAAQALDALITSGHLLAGSRVDIVRSPVAVAVREGAAGAIAPDISTEAALRQAVLAAASISFSTGPSGTYLLQLFERWGISASVQDRLVQAPPGVPVGSLVARGEVALGFQQLSELMHLPGIQVLGTLPSGTEHITTFSGAVCATSKQPDAVRHLLAYLAAPDTGAVKHKHGMQPA
jgi:molybdate transport system substrate-binding protein